MAKIDFDLENQPEQLSLFNPPEGVYVMKVIKEDYISTYNEAGKMHIFDSRILTGKYEGKTCRIQFITQHETDMTENIGRSAMKSFVKALGFGPGEFTDTQKARECVFIVRGEKSGKYFQPKEFLHADDETIELKDGVEEDNASPPKPTNALPSNETPQKEIEPPPHQDNAAESVKEESEEMVQASPEPQPTPSKLKRKWNRPNS